ncbi:DinB family protein [Marinoscillum sp.]|uniref:DinB family protein n=1 Tax=Marinoscillum sp. TaxID=2024838 RepID=UPI003BAC9173
MKISRPHPSEYGHFYRGYIDKVADQDVRQLLDKQLNTYQSMISHIDEEQMHYAYTDGKWTVAQVLGHINDTERIMAYRILRFSRRDKTELPGFDENEYVLNGDFKEVTKDSFLDEFLHLRKSNLVLIDRLSDEVLAFTGESNGMIFSVRALIHILAGHLKHHMDILVERYKLKIL